MGIAVGAHQGRDFQPIAAYIADEIAEDREAGDDSDLGVRRLLRGGQARRHHTCRQ